MRKAENCLVELLKRKEYDLVNKQNYKMMKTIPIPEIVKAPVVFPSKFNISDIEEFLCKNKTTLKFKTSPASKSTINPGLP